MAKADYQTEVSVPKNKFFKVISNYELYPKFIEGVSRIEVIEREGNRVRAKYFMNLLKEIEYVVDHFEDEKNGKLHWELVESSFMKKNKGSWTLEEIDEDETEVRYQVEVDFSFPAPSFVVNKLIKASLPKMVESIEKEARRL